MTTMVEVEGLTEVAEGVLIRPMTTANRAIDLYLGEVQRRLRPRTHKTYSRILDQLLDFLPVDEDVAKITDDQVGRFLDRQLRKARGTQAQYFTCLKCFFDWAARTEKIKRSPMRNMLAPRRLPAEALDVTTLSTDDVRKLLAAARGWTERLSVALPAYMGCRRHAAAQLRVKDYDQGIYVEAIDEETGEPIFGQKPRLRFQEKGGKTIWKPVPDELAVMLDARLSPAAVAAGGALGADSSATSGQKSGETFAKTSSGRRLEDGTGSVTPVGAISPDDYLIPNESTARKGERDDRVVWAAVKRCAGRAGVDAHVHALRAAFACFYLETNRGDLEALQPLMGHRNLTTTQVYLRRLNRETAMDRVRSLSWQDPAVAGVEIDYERRVGESHFTYADEPSP